MSAPASAPRLALAALAGLAALLPLAAQAQVNKCTRSDGSVTFQSAPCAANLKAAAAAAAARPVAPAKASQPYFDPYAAAPGEGQRGTLVIVPPRQVAPPAAPLRPAVVADRDAGPAAVQQQVNSAQQRQTQRLQAEVQQLREVNRQQNCNTARNNVEVLGRQRPVWHLDAQGNKQYVEDADRDRAMSTARQQVASNCN